MHTLSRHERFLPHLPQSHRAAARIVRPGTAERLTLAMAVLGIVIGAAGIVRALLVG
jgi:hypothetical protein